jgi:hypothetical protein
MLVSLGFADTFNMRMIMLDMTDLKPCLPYHVEFQIAVAYTTKTFT